MSDETYFFVAILFGMTIVIGSIYMLLSRRYRASEKKPNEKIDQLAATQAESKFENDLVNNPAFSDMEINIFHQNHCDNDD
ncbi:hypothetical protein DSCO28_13450 [Desulfosarcina ovata subsp. sediminis]|uniref:Uncharacterized protein n=1 Tax=Desulfosarcina ovata subsp. sediminis TaxID=885957 RepID=A0A5K7ZMD7_9BACT|nr:hypothetical protein [Desulfosarcina ovata]BBO80779.1 hypothetical protein DSCO28_13450 [Desulfosarcina ovata subsp. sediminis]